MVFERPDLVVADSQGTITDNKSEKQTSITSPTAEGDKAQVEIFLDRDDDPDEVYSSAYRAKMATEAALARGRGRLKIKDYRKKDGDGVSGIDRQSR